MLVKARTRVRAFSDACTGIWACYGTGEGALDLACLDAPLLWWALSALSALFVLADWRHAPIDTTMHFGFLLVTAFTGPLGAVLYVLTVREPLPGTHREYIRPLWKPSLGSTFHCVAGDSVGIVGAAAVATGARMPMTFGLLVEYGAVFGGMAGVSVTRCEGHGGNGGGDGALDAYGARIRKPGNPFFWLMMSVALTAGALVAYPINWWLVARHVKDGLMSTTPPAIGPAARRMHRPATAPSSMHHSPPAPGREGHLRTMASTYHPAIVLVSAALFLAALFLW